MLDCWHVLILHIVTCHLSLNILLIMSLFVSVSEVPADNKSSPSPKYPKEEKMSLVQRTPSDVAEKTTAPPDVVKRNKDSKDCEVATRRTSKEPELPELHELSAANGPPKAAEKKPLARRLSKERSKSPPLVVQKHKEGDENSHLGDVSEAPFSLLKDSTTTKSAVKLPVEQKSSGDKLVTVKRTSSKTDSDVTKEEEKENKAPSPIPTEPKAEVKDTKKSSDNKTANVVAPKVEKPTTPPKPRKNMVRPASPQANNKSDDEDTPDPPLSLKERMAMLRNAAGKDTSAGTKTKPATPAWKRTTPATTVKPKPSDVYIQVKDAPKPVENGSKHEVDTNDNRGIL